VFWVSQTLLGFAATEVSRNAWLFKTIPNGKGKTYKERERDLANRPHN